SSAQQAVGICIRDGVDTLVDPRLKCLQPTDTRIDFLKVRKLHSESFDSTQVDFVVTIGSVHVSNPRNTDNLLQIRLVGDYAIALLELFQSAAAPCRRTPSLRR